MSEHLVANADAAAASPYVLEVERVSKRFPGVQALSDVNLRLRPGTVHALVGENGAGKSTLMNIISGMFPPSSGEIRLDGALSHSPRRARRWPPASP